MLGAFDLSKNILKHQDKWMHKYVRCVIQCSSQVEQWKYDSSWCAKNVPSQKTTTIALKYHTKVAAIENRVKSLTLSSLWYPDLHVHCDAPASKFKLLELLIQLSKIWPEALFSNLKLYLWRWSSLLALSTPSCYRQKVLLKFSFGFFTLPRVFATFEEALPFHTRDICHLSRN